MLLLTASSTLALPLIDMMTAHDEIPMLRYRLQLHAPLAVKTIILESNLSHAGYPKPLHVRNALTQYEIEKYKIELINVPFGHDLEQRMFACRNSSSVKCTWLLEVAQRKFVMSMLQPTIDRVLSELNLDDVFVHMSDLDELLDIDTIRTLNLTGCTSPKLRNFVYGERCPATYPSWSRSVLFRAKSGWLQKHASPSLQLRKLAKGKDCSASKEWLGWHFGYFMSTERIVVRRCHHTPSVALRFASDSACCSHLSQHKLSNFAHAHDAFIQRITKGKDPIKDMERRVSHCLDVHGRKYGPTWAAYDGKLPAVPGWPRNPVAPAAFNLSVLEKEIRMHEGEVARIKKKATIEQPPDGTIAWPLRAALGRLSSTRAAIEERKRAASGGSRR